jgi:hypothetical protein
MQSLSVTGQDVDRLERYKAKATCSHQTVEERMLETRAEFLLEATQVSAACKADDHQAESL